MLKKISKLHLSLCLSLLCGFTLSTELKAAEIKDLIIEASSTFPTPDSVAENAIDGDIYSHWLGAATARTYSLVIELPDNYTMDRVDLYWYAETWYGTKQPFAPRKFSVDVYYEEQKQGNTLTGRLKFHKLGPASLVRVNLQGRVATHLVVTIDKAHSPHLWIPALGEIRPSGTYLGYSWHNASNPADINRDGLVTVGDLLAIMNAFRARGTNILLPPLRPTEERYLDVNRDNYLTMSDFLLVWNAL